MGIEMVSDTTPRSDAPPTPGTHPAFPVVWEHPEDEQQFWTQETAHFPKPIGMLEYVITEIAHHAGFNRAAHAYGLPLRGQVRRIGGYLYTAMVPVAPPEQIEARGRLAEERIRPVAMDLGRHWEAEWLPEIRRHLADMRAFDLAGASLSELAAHLEPTIARVERLWEIHFQLAFPMLLALSEFDDFYRDLFGDDDAFQAYRLLQGFQNTTLEANQALWALSRRAVAEPAVGRIFAALPVGEIVPALEADAVGRAFLGQLRQFLEAYGRRSDSWGLQPGWVENPAPVLRNLKDYVGQPDRDLAAERAALVAERERALAEARARLAGYPRPVVDQFEALLASAQVANVLSEEHGFWIDFSSTYEVRRVFLELGRRLVDAGALADPEDVFLLSVDEVRATVAASPPLNRQALAAERRDEIARAATMTPPPALGTPPAGAPPEDAIGRAIVKMFGGGPPPPSDDPRELRGNAGSPGMVTGTARVVHSLDEADRIRPGDILVTEFTAPPWTPLFATVAAVVTDAGGILSHCAVVAREYAIPAVVGTGRATAVIRDGQQVEVDGNAGLVRLLD